MTPVLQLLCQDTARALRTIRPCLSAPGAGTTALARRCPPGSGELSAAAVCGDGRRLARRGSPTEARRFLDGELPPHDPFLLGDMRGGVRARSARRSQPASGSASTATTTSTASAPPRSPSLLAARARRRRRLAPAEPLRRGLRRRRQTLARLADEGCGLVLTVDCGITAVDEVAEAQAARPRRDRHRPPPAGRDAARLPDRRARGRPSIRSRSSAAPASSTSSAEALLGADSAISTRHLDLVALATIADVVPLVDENRALAIAGLRALARTQKPGLRALMRAAGVDPATVTRAPSASASAPRINAAGRLGHPRAALELLLTDDAGRGAAAGRAARGAEPRPPGGRGADPPRGVARSRRGPSRARAPPRLRRRRRGLARGRDRHRRLAARRALPAARSC